MIRYILPLLLLASVAVAETRTYLVYRRDNFPQDRYALSFSPQEYKLFIDTGKKTIDEAKGQPFRMTSYDINYDGKYAVWKVSFKDEDELKHIDSMQNKGYIKLLSTTEIVPVWGHQRGWQDEVKFQSLAELPTDYYEIGISSGT